jgi:hypothetical protein
VIVYGSFNPVIGNAKTTNQSYIPEKLQDFLSDSILNSKEKTVLKSMVSDKKLSNKEIAAYASDKTVAKYKKMLKDYGGYVLLVDADNDGIKDLFFVINDGGSMGNNSRILLKGNKNGTFKMTSDKMNVTQELAFIRYKGKNYLLETNFAYDNKYYNGLTIICFKNGKIYEKVNLTLKADGYDISVKPQKEEYKALAEEASAIARKHYNIGNMDGEIVKGNAEAPLSKTDYEAYEKNLYFMNYNWFSSDINNDGQKEIYTKGIFESSTIHTSTCLQDALLLDNTSKSDSYPEILSYYNIDVKGIPMMFWISTVNNENILNLITYGDITDYAVTGYLINGKSVSKAYEVNFKGKRKVESKVYTRGINYVDNENGWE